MTIQVKQVIELNPLKAKAAELPAPTPIERPTQPPVAKRIEASQSPALAVKRARGRPQSGKETVTLRLSVKVVEHFKPLGKGWKQAINAYLVESLKL